MQNLKFGCSIFRDMTSQKFSFQKETSHRDSIFTPWNRTKLETNHFLCLKTFFLSQNYTPSAFAWFSSKTKKLKNFRDVLFQKQLQQPPW